MPKGRRSTRRIRALDELDLRLLALLRDDARISLVALGRALGLGTATVHERLRRLRARGYIAGYHARLDYARLGLGLSAYVMLQTQQVAAARATLDENLRRMPEVEELAWVTGEFDAVVRVRARDTAHLQDVLFRIADAGQRQVRARTLVVLSHPFWKPGPDLAALAVSEATARADPPDG
jgi:DNA-binding Lrp family transcriptional regulator